MSNISTILHPQFGEIRQFTSKNKPWFNANDVCNALGHSNPRKAVADHCRTEGVTKRYTPTQGGEQELSYIDEGNLYRLIFRSKLPSARQFESWVCDEVLPAIRKHGYYLSPRFRYEPSNNQELGRDFQNIIYRELLKVDNNRLRNRLGSLVEYYVSKIS